MAGNPDNAALWAEADVYVAPLGSPLPANADAPFSSAWKLVGLLDGDDGFSESRDEDKNDYFAWGGILVRTARRHFKLTKSFSVLEDNATTRGLIWPGSTDSEIVVPRPGKVMLAFETREGAKVKRVITRRHAEVDVAGDITENESDLTKVSLDASIFPDGDGVLFDRQESGAPVVP